jgi:UDP-N-acetylglucosamine 2-epimerase (non-hydrolysing)
VSGGICFVVGARPNFMKTAPVLHALRRLEPSLPALLVHTGQHYDPEMSDVFLRELDLPRPDVFLGIGSGTHAQQTARALEGVERVLLERRPELVVVAGDVNSTLAGALAAVKLGLPVAHLEAGLRSFDPTMPEEVNRKLTDHVSDLLLAHSASALENLAAEGIPPERVELVGNTMITTLLRHVDAARAREPWARFGLEPGAYALVTLHRPALVDGREQLEATLAGLDALAADLPVLFPVHPRTRERLEAQGIAPRSERVRLAEPLGYLDFLGLEAGARVVVTDSGGVQEETTALGVRCFTLRDTTERPVTVELGTNTILGARPERLAEIPALLEEERTPTPVPLWDELAGERAAAALAAFVAAAAPV